MPREKELEEGMKIVVFEAESWVKPVWSELEHEHEIGFVKEYLSPANISGHEEADIISVDMSILSGDVLSRFSHLKMIAARCTGVDKIDLNYCGKKGIVVCNVPHYAENAVAEHVFALLLSISHHIVEASERTRRVNFSWEGIQAFELRGKNLAVLGTGSIGRRVAEIGGGFGMNLFAFDIEPDWKWAADYGVEYLSFKDTLGCADIVTLHVPAVPGGGYMLSDVQFDLMKDGVVLINTARGELIDPRALLRALAAGKVAYAGLDVLPEEQAIREDGEQLATLLRQKNDMGILLANQMLLNHPKVLITPHNAFFSREAVQKLLDITKMNILGFIQGKPQNVI